MGSTRLPGKVMRKLMGRPMLAQQLRRLSPCRRVDEIVIATTRKDEDDPIVGLADKHDCMSYRGSEYDVVARFLGACRQARADLVIRITADCPLIDAGLVDQVIEEASGHAAECDYVSNTIKRTFPRGLDVEAFFHDTLERINRLAVSTQDREHVTSLLRGDKRGLFAVRSVEDDHDNSDLRWTVDTPTDWKLIAVLYEQLELDEHILPYRHILAHVRANPELAQINSRGKTWDPSDSER
jgi:spore coat polysaccharide biosynthesis protein SpsF